MKRDDLSALAAFGLIVAVIAGQTRLTRWLGRGIEIVGDAIVDLGDPAGDFMLVSCDGREPVPWDGVS